jgi:hypothetical protein
MFKLQRDPILSFSYREIPGLFLKQKGRRPQIMLFSCHRQAGTSSPVYSSSKVNSSEALCRSEYAPLASSSNLPLETELEALSLAAYVTSRRQQHLELILINKAGALHEDILLSIFSYLVPTPA